MDSSDHPLKRAFERIFCFAHFGEWNISKITTERAGMNGPSQSVGASSWAGEAMIGKLLFPWCGSAGGLKHGRVRIRDWCFIIEGALDANKTGQAKLMIEDEKWNRGFAIEVAHGSGKYMLNMHRDHTHSEQQWVLADPLNRSNQVTLQWDLSVFSASQQHAVLKGEIRGWNWIIR